MNPYLKGWTTEQPSILMLDGPISFDHLFDKFVPNDILVVQINHFDALYVLENQEHLLEAGNGPSGKIDLPWITCNQELGVFPHPCQEHFHLGMCGILGFIQYHKRIVQCTSAHKGHWCNLNGAIVQ